ncbi:hypothetical protein ABZ370_29865 [Streptomyces sp. NPDC005962]
MPGSRALAEVSFQHDVPGLFQGLAGVVLDDALCGALDSFAG